MSGDLAPNISSRDKTLAIVAKNYKKNNNNRYQSFLFLSYFTLFLYFRLFFFLLGKRE